MKAFRHEWRSLGKEEKTSHLDAKRQELRLTDEFARLFPAEAYKARTAAGVEPPILVEL